MADLKSELMRIQPLTTLDFDDDADGHMTNVVEIVATRDEPLNISRTQQIWEVVKLHPGCSISEIQMMVPKLARADISTRLNQMRHRGLITYSPSPTTGKRVHHVAGDTFTSVSREERLARMKVGRAQWLAERAAKNEKRTYKKRAPVETYNPVEPIEPVEAAPVDDVDLFVSKLTVAYALSLYKALGRVFT